MFLSGQALAAELPVGEDYMAPQGDLLPAVTARSAVVMEAQPTAQEVLL